MPGNQYHRPIMRVRSVVALALLLASCAPAPAQARGRVRVPPVAPDSVPQWIYNPSNRVGEGSPWFLRNIIVLGFKEGTTRVERQEAVDLIGGEVIGGVQYGVGEGEYYVRIQDDGTTEPLFRAIDLLETLPQVSFAATELVNAYGPEPSVGDPISDPEILTMAAGDTLLEPIYSRENWVGGLPCMSGRTLKNIVFVVFTAESALEERQAAIARVDGEAVGKDSLYGDRGYYYVRVPEDGSGRLICDAIQRLDALPQVELVHPVLVDPSDL